MFITYLEVDSEDHQVQDENKENNTIVDKTAAFFIHKVLLSTFLKQT